MDKNNDNVISLDNGKMVKYGIEEVIDMQKESELYNTVYKEISELIGLDATLKIYLRFKGQQVNFPIRLYNPQLIHQNVIKEFDGYCIGYTAKGEEFYFDKEDCDLVKKYCWYIDNLGYVATNIVTDEGKRTVLRMHTLIMQPSDSALKIDHIHGRESRNDNRKYNLRIATNQENSINAGLKSNNTSGVTGVGWDKRYGKWQARIKKNYKSIHLGYFDAFEDAVNARKEAEEKYFGEFAYDYSQQMEVEV